MRHHNSPPRKLTNYLRIIYTHHAIPLGGATCRHPHTNTHFWPLLLALDPMHAALIHTLQTKQFIHARITHTLTRNACLPSQDALVLHSKITCTFAHDAHVHVMVATAVPCCTHTHTHTTHKYKAHSTQLTHLITLLCYIIQACVEPEGYCSFERRRSVSESYFRFSNEKLGLGVTYPCRQPWWVKRKVT